MLEPLLREKEQVSSVVAIGAALVPSPGLLLFVAHPDIFEKLDTTHLLVLLPGVGVSMLTVCVLATLFIVEGAFARGNRRRKQDGLPVLERRPTEDWPMLVVTAGYANLVFLVLTVWAYWHPIRLGAALFTASAIILVGSLLIGILPRRVQESRNHNG